jgi:hypothetical protein
LVETVNLQIDRIRHLSQMPRCVTGIFQNGPEVTERRSDRLVLPDTSEGAATSREMVR